MSKDQFFAERERSINEIDQSIENIHRMIDESYQRIHHNIKQSHKNCTAIIEKSSEYERSTRG